MRLQSKPELNGSWLRLALVALAMGRRLKFVHQGRYGFVDEFLRENERYRIFVPVACREIHH